MTASTGESLGAYRRRRRFRRTTEQRGGREEPGRRLRFVVQQHKASRLHYDFRLEADGVLKSWAVPKGPSTDPGEKRLAVATEDHPLEYAGFEGTIPKGEYGAGTVAIWDRGTYSNLTKQDGRRISMAEGLARGHIAFKLNGRKLKGGFALTRARGLRADGGKEQWLLVKMNDEYAGRGRKAGAT
jgi:bifunctional non-homologous end joining protein LigD